MKKHLRTRSNIKGKRVHGFRARQSSRSGRRTLSRRRRKGRWELIPA
ncbi:MAG: 50S ribosomal protein L34 [Candidatus Omnitrophica bacterium]|nr:50S ribosomal protein L34 [Candidatus Omnitrophota bacterium]